MTRLAEVWRMKTVHSPSRSPDACNRSETASVTSFRPRRVWTSNESTTCLISSHLAQPPLQRLCHNPEQKVRISEYGSCAAGPDRCGDSARGSDGQPDAREANRCHQERADGLSLVPAPGDHGRPRR